MRRALAILLLLLAWGCDHSDSFYEHRRLEHRMGIDAYNCEFEATHRKNAQGAYEPVQVEEERLKQMIRQCMEAKGYDLSGKPGPEAETAPWWWPF